MPNGVEPETEAAESGGDGTDYTQSDPLPPDSLAPPPPDKPFDPEPEREKVRARVTYLLTGSVAGLAITAFVVLAAGWVSQDDLEKLALFFTPLITLAGTALGFYFGGRGGR